jgi:predicted nucleic acid-binding protein
VRYFLDTCIAIYVVEGPALFQNRARAHIVALEQAGHTFLVSELVRTECLIKPLGAGSGPLLLDYFRFFLSPNLTTVTLTSAMHARAALIRGIHKFGLADSLHLAAAIEAGCDRFLTNDHRLGAYPDIDIDVLP